MSTTAPSVIISPIYNSDLALIVQRICVQLQECYDMSPVLIDRLICDSKYSQILYQIYEPAYEKLITKINNLSVDPETLYDERCGRIVTVHPNKIEMYCNKHKYLHSADQLLDHSFIPKDEALMIKEYRHTQIHHLYQDFINGLYFTLYDQTIKYLDTHSRYIEHVTTEQMIADPLMYKLKSKCKVYRFTSE